MSNTNYITGYRRQTKNPWPRLWAILIILLIIFLWIIISTPNPHTPQKPKPMSPPAKTPAIQTKVEAIIKAPVSAKTATAEKSSVLQQTLNLLGRNNAPENQPNHQKVLEAAITNALYSGTMPNFNITQFSARTQRIYYYTKIQTNQVPATVYHVWYTPKGEVASTVPLNLTGTNSSTYSYHTVDAEEVGTWKVLTRDSHQQILHSTSFVVENR